MHQSYYYYCYIVKFQAISCTCLIKMSFIWGNQFDLLFRFTVPDAQCFEIVGSGVYNNRAIRVTSDDGRDLLVYAVNRDEHSADG